MKHRFHIQNKGFTLIELMVVVAIIAVLSGALLTVVFNARMQARDMARQSVVEQLALAVRLYKEAEGTYPDYDDGEEVSLGTELGQALLPYMKGFADDTMRSEDVSEYQYWYVSNFNCTKAGQRVVYMSTLERPENSNTVSLCGADIGEDVGGFMKIVP